MELIFLGTSSMIPTEDRNHFSNLLLYKDEGILVDCGENTQRQLRIAKIPVTKITKILITHWHGDHVLGLPGVLQSLEKHQYNKSLEIYGPKGSKKYFSHMFRGFDYRIKIKYKLVEVNKRIFFKNNDFSLEALKLDHSIPCLGYSFIENDRRKINMEYLKKFSLKSHPIIKKLQQGKDIIWKGKKIKAKLSTSLKEGKKIAFITDTRVCDNILKLTKNSDIIVSEATFREDFEEKAKLYKHLTTKQAALIAKKSTAKRLILTHFSQRYKDLEELKKEASKIFYNVYIAEDFMRISL
ncbi:ribonuclease Z [Candidatus Woesearchaeota archaeon]|nr:ribonuclease Z [Candidatus Woesearchaeota archaeon]